MTGTLLVHAPPSDARAVAAAAGVHGFVTGPLRLDAGTGAPVAPEPSRRGPGAPLVGAVLLDLPEDADLDAMLAGVQRLDATVPVAFAWRGSVAAAAAVPLDRWLARTPGLGTAPPEQWPWIQECRAMELPPDARAASTARHVVRSIGLGDADLAASIELASSELATNATLHGRPPVELVVVTSPEEVYVGVSDTGSGALPRRRRAGRHDEAGRGLTIVASIADWWGVTILAERILVWCDVGRTTSG